MRRIGSFVVVLLLASCESPQAPKVSPATDPDLRKILVHMGFRPEDIRDAGNHFLAEGDIAFSKSDLRTLLPGTRPDFQYAYPHSVNSTTVQYITVDTSQLESSWKTAASAAIQAWNSIPGSRVTFVAVGSSGEVGAVMTDSLQFGTCQDSVPTTVRASAGFPDAFGSPGDSIRISNQVTINNCLTSAQKIRVFAHELGHIVGIVHTDGWCCNATLIPGTPSSDPGSVFRRHIGNGSWPGFTLGDERAAYYMYPQLDDPGVSVTYPAGVPTFAWSPVPDNPVYSIGFFEYSWWIDDQQEFWSYGDYVYTGAQTTSNGVTVPSYPHTGYSSCQYGAGGPGTSYMERTWFIRLQYPHGGYREITIGPAEIVPC